MKKKERQIESLRKHVEKAILITTEIRPNLFDYKIDLINKELNKVIGMIDEVTR